MSWNVGLIGSGRMGRRHARAYSQHPGFCLSAAMDPDETLLDRFRTEWNVASSARTVEELLDAAPMDVISLCSPTEFHFPQTQQILRSPRRPRLLFIEKPVCLTEEELSQIEAMARETKVAVAVNHTRRFDPAHRRLIDWARSPRMGCLLEGQCAYYGGWINNGSHWVDLIRMLFPEEPRVAAASPAESGRGRDKDLRVELRVGPAPIRLEPFDEKHYQIFEADFRFEAGRIRILDFGKQVSVEEAHVNSRGERLLTSIEGAPWAGLSGSIPAAVERIADTLEGKDALAVTGADLATAAETMRLVWTAQQMAARADG